MNFLTSLNRLFKKSIDLYVVYYNLEWHWIFDAENSHSIKKLILTYSKE